jgi:hypothetical protein
MNMYSRKVSVCPFIRLELILSLTSVNTSDTGRSSNTGPIITHASPRMAHLTSELITDNRG